ncbi:hypothetical protein BDN72DRAFT_844718 [Pluteus cervinus]|uniref:Uncharacterized protein n=1 Tax=Pluteus cervinus TaxID=181527 RepID=A0ACD3AKG0_9AGAR|nr:hypothetical protein BDN72DRAFT_844718 [Pluteus cervinus]
MALPFPTPFLLFSSLSTLFCIFIFTFSLLNVTPGNVPMAIDAIIAIFTIIYHGAVLIVQARRRETKGTPTTATQPNPCSSITSITWGYIMILVWVLALLITITANCPNNFMGVQVVPPRNHSIQVADIVFIALEIIVLGVIAIWCTVERNRLNRAQAEVAEEDFFFSTT